MAYGTVKPERAGRSAQEDIRQTALIRQAWTASGRICGYHKLADHLRDLGKTIPKYRPARLASCAGIPAQIGYRRRSGRHGGKPASTVMVYSDQGIKFTCREWQTFLRQNTLQPSMSRRGNCQDSAVAESFIQLPKRQQIRRRTDPTRDAARQGMFEYIEQFYNPKRKRTTNGMLSPDEFETGQKKRNAAGL